MMQKTGTRRHVFEVPVVIVVVIIVVVIIVVVVGEGLVSITRVIIEGGESWWW